MNTNQDSNINFINKENNSIYENKYLDVKQDIGIDPNSKRD